MNSNSKSVSRKFVVFTALIFSVIVFLLIWWLLPRYQSGQIVNKGVQPNEISIRQADGQIQWQYLDGEWNSIISVDELRGQDGEDGADGVDGVDGQNGTSGARGVAGQNGLQGVAGSAGEKGDKGDTGAIGATGEKGETGAPGADGLNGTDGKDGVNGQDGKDGQNGVDGQDGREIEIQKGPLYIQWRYVGDSNWNNIIAYSDLKGEKGDKGDTGAIGATGEKGETGTAGQNATISVTNSTQPCSTGLNVTGNGTSNLGLQFTGSSVPEGGMTGQVLAKNSNNNCDFIWKDTYELRGTGMPEGVVTANVGTYYTDTLATNGAVRWVKATGTGNTGWKVVYGDTGWRNISSYFDTTASDKVGQQILIRRVNDTVQVQFHGVLKRNGSVASFPSNEVSGFNFASRVDSPGVSTVKLYIGGQRMTINGTINVNDASVLHLTDTQFTGDRWPTVLPGLPN